MYFSLKIVVGGSCLQWAYELDICLLRIPQVFSVLLNGAWPLINANF